jgi:HK97 gp10 family phage protein
MKFTSNRKNVEKALTNAEKTVLLGIGEFVEGQAKLLAPVDTGNLRGSITYQVNEENQSVMIGTNTEYAVHQEKGTSRTQAQPFLTPAAENNIKEIRALAERLFKL